MAVYLVALALIALLFWVLPRATHARELSDRSAALFQTMRSAQNALASAQANVAELDQRLVEAREQLEKLRTSRSHNAKTIEALNAEIDELEAQRAAAQQGSQSTTEGTGVSIAPRPTPPPPPCIVLNPTGSPYPTPCGSGGH
ncbi:MAG TPA: hypothetical protein VKA30_06380 [Actinomycetota bacterium]|nr:hypothetical protein [Actinomycetota bacterium]